MNYPYNTGKVLIGRDYIPPMTMPILDEDASLLQRAIIDKRINKKLSIIKVLMWSLIVVALALYLILTTSAMFKAYENPPEKTYTPAGVRG
jgi:hypothetical protein